MNLWTTISEAKQNLAPGEFLVTSQDGVRIDHGDKKTQYVNGELALTSHKMLWSNPAILGHGSMTLPLSLIVQVQEDFGAFMQSEKLKVLLEEPATKKAHHIRLSFKQGGVRPFSEKIHEALRQKRWEVKVIRPKTPAQRVMRSGIGGIEKSMEKKIRQTDSEISKAFQDIDKLMEMAKPMVGLAKVISSKIRDKQGSGNDDETTQFKSYLMSLGISDPVTRDTHGSGQAYFTQLSKEIYKILDVPLQESGGMMTLTDAFCRVNRARGMELLSPEDLLNACKNFSISDCPIILHTFEETGVTVLQLASSLVNSEKVLGTTEDIVSERLTNGITADEFARTCGIAVVLAKERLLAAEGIGRICRDDSVEGLRFFPNLILTAS